MIQKAQHVAIIMDGNGRWANQRKQKRTFGHTEGAERASEIMREAGNLVIKSLTLYTFSTENWQRPEFEVSFIMKLLMRYLRNESWEIIEKNNRFRAVGFTEMLPKEIQEEIRRLEEASAQNTGTIINLALSYGSRQEITHATKKIAQAMQEGKIRPEDITEELMSKHMLTSHVPDPDLLIRTGGDQRISNFLLWQSAYTEFYFTDLCWPDFTVAELQKALDSFTQRQRRFGNAKDEIE